MISESLVVSILFFILGAVVGSFLNVCIVRLPQGLSVVIPGSHCLKCQKPIRPFDNIPLLSYLLLRGRCRQCHEKFSVRYFFIELLTALLFVFFYRYFGLTPLLLPYLVMLCCFIISTFVDWEHRIIPDEISVGGMIAGFIFSIFFPALHGVPADKGLMAHFISAGYALLGILVGGGSIYLMGVLGDLIFKKESMGGGDVKFLALVGAFLGWKLALLTFFLAPFFGAVYGVYEKIRTKESAIPYGPFLVMAALISVFWGEIIIHWLLRGYVI